jgi:hypothetical protein
MGDGFACFGPCLGDHRSIEDPQEQTDDEERELVDRAGDRHEAERDQRSERSRDAAVASEDLDCPDQAPNRSEHASRVSVKRDGGRIPPTGDTDCPRSLYNVCRGRGGKAAAPI